MSETGHAAKPRDGGDDGPVTEFGGSAGAVVIMVASYGLVYFMWIAWRFHDGATPFPTSLSEVSGFTSSAIEQISTHAAPTWEAAFVYLGFVAMQAGFAAFLPGIRVKGLPLPSAGGRRLEYVANALWAWYATLALVSLLHFSGVYPLGRVADNFGSMLTIAVGFSTAVSLLLYFGARLTGNAHRMSGRPIHDFFMGAWLNPRIGRLDLKMFAEARTSWLLLFLLTASAAAKQFETWGTISTPMIFMLVAHGLYTNAIMKGEECIPYTWDIFYEKLGWMLTFWNFAGVPFFYCFNAYYLLQRAPFEHSIPYTVMCFSLLIGAYFVWDTAQAQRNHFRMQERGTLIRRKAFPQLPWAHLKDPRYMETAQGSKLLIDGWWKYARKIHYTADIVMALSWGLICGFDHYLPYLYVSFFVVMIVHRERRDFARCRRKYGADWERYTREVPHVFIPRVY